MMKNVYIKLNIVTGITKTSQMVNLFNTMIIIVLLKMVTYFQYRLKYFLINMGPTILTCI